jgi:aldose 1-epimerase
MAIFGTTPRGERVELFTLSHPSGLEARITSFGGRLVSLRVPDRGGRLADVVLGCDHLEGYLVDRAYLGAIVGRYANRIAHGRFVLGGRTCRVPANEGDHALHGGPSAFEAQVWTAADASTPGAPALRLSRLSRDGENGFPGNLAVAVTYTLTETGGLRLDYAATTDRDTVLNLTHHGYFNLKGAGQGDVLDHRLQLFAGRFTPVDRSQLPTGELRGVQGTPFDFREATPLGARIDVGDPQLEIAGGYDQNFVLDRFAPGKLALAARVSEPTTGRVLEVLTDQPGLQLYSGNQLDGSSEGKGGAVYAARSGLCLETQHFPDSPNRPAFPSTVLRAGARFVSTTVYRFGIDG